MAKVHPEVAKEPKDRHPEISAPILDLSLEARIARAEQRVVDRGTRVRGDAARIVGTLRSKRGQAVRWAAIGVGVVAVGAIGYAGWRVWRGRASAHREARGGSTRACATGPGFVAELAAFMRTAVQWALRLHREQGVTGSIFGIARSALWPKTAQDGPRRPSRPTPRAGRPPRARDPISQTRLEPDAAP